MPLRLVFFGSDPIALPLLNWLREETSLAELTAVYTQPDQPEGRGQKMRPNAVKAWALDRGLPVWQPERLGEPDRLRLMEGLTDVALIMAYGQILRESFIAAPRLATLNLHTSLLPQFRGASPIQSAVAAGEAATGVTLMRIVRQLDAGPLADRERVTIGALDTAAEVEAKLAAACPELMARTLPKLARGELAFVEQDHARATYCRRLTREDGALDWTAPASVLAARINGLFPWPACSVQVGGQPVKIGLADVSSPELQTEPGKPGEVTGQDGEGLLVAAGQGTVRLRRLQRPGGRMLAAPEFLRGFPIAKGTRFASHPMPALVAPQPFRGQGGQ